MDHDRHADARHTPWSDPGAHKARLRELPAGGIALADALEEFVIHHAVARFLGFGVPEAAEGDRDLRKACRLLDAALGRDGRPLSAHRDLADYLYVTCRDFALLAASVLRENGVPARLRVGFAGYFNAGKWEDHWICQHWTGERWAALDAQLGRRARTGMGLTFDVADVPDTGWRSAPSIWRGIRAGAIDPEACGLSYAGLTGPWFVASSVLRDAAALAGIETLPWDYWGPGREFGATRQVPDERARDIDRLAAALDPAPDTRREAEAVLDRFPWARPTPTILTFPQGRRGAAEIVLAS